jgi:hypothetical protein
MASKRPTPAPAAEQSERPYYIVNPKGCIHIVDRAHAANRLRQVGWRMATAAEREAYHANGEQRFDRPLATPWSPDPDAQLDVDAE